MSKISELIPDDRNANKHSEAGMELLKKGLKENGLGRSILISSDNKIIAGNGVTESAGAIGMEDVQIVDSDGTKIIAVRRTDIKSGTKEFYNMALSDNIIAKENIVMDADVVDAICEEYEIEEWKEYDNSINGNNEEKEAEAHKKLIERFIVPPFSVLDTRQGYWIERKTHWKTLICDNGESREKALSESELMGTINNGVSVLDPVLAEIANLWFGLPGCNSFDCFSGDSVFGYVSSYLGNCFTGIELRKEQTELNNERVKGFNAKYICDDGRNVLSHIKLGSQDLLFSCPPYFDLEVYSNLPNDASNQENYVDFLKILDVAFENSTKCLKNNRFAVIVVGDLRNNGDGYYNFPSDIKNIFINNGMILYNELVIVETLGTLPQRVGRCMNNRKIGKCHQNVLVFYKGDPKEIKNIYPKIEFDESQNV